MRKTKRRQGIRAAVSTALAVVMALGAIVLVAGPSAANGGTEVCNPHRCVATAVVAYVDVVGNGTFAGARTVVIRAAWGGIGVAFSLSGWVRPGRHYRVQEVWVGNRKGVTYLLAYRFRN